jgi:hypothetical protein
VAAKAAAATTSSPGTGTFKLLVWLLIVLNVAAAGGWVWFKFFRNAQAQQNLNTTKRRLVKLQTDLDVLSSMVRNIASTGVNEVEDPGRLIGDVAKNVALSDAIQYGVVNSQRFYRTNYTEKTVRVTFLNKRIYSFSDVVKFLTLLEAANPTVQIKDIDFGKRYPPTVGSDAWIPTSATVRVLQLSSAPGS